jgi:phosphate transport system protein
MVADPDNPQPGELGLSVDRRILLVKRRLIREAAAAIHMLENALKALFEMDTEAALRVRLSDDKIDTEEVAIEQECYAILALHHPFAHDFRVLTFVLRMNADIERTADHATSIAKIVVKISQLGVTTPPWPTALVELAHRVPALCHELMRSVLDEDVSAARHVVASDEVIDQLDRRLFDETLEMLHAASGSDADLAMGMYIYRLGRELERIGDLMASIAEHVVYLATGEIIRHAKHRKPS